VRLKRTRNPTKTQTPYLYRHLTLTHEQSTSKTPSSKIPLSVPNTPKVLIQEDRSILDFRDARAFLRQFDASKILSLYTRRGKDSKNAVKTQQTGQNAQETRKSRIDFSSCSTLKLL
jgi:hypothetical protein